MERIQRFLQQAAFAIAVLLVFLLMVEPSVVVPAWLGPAGRMHPLLLHLPIGFVFVLGLLAIVRRESDGLAGFESFLLHVTVVSALLTALSGFFLQQVADYDLQALRWHKWGGSSVALVGYACLIFYGNATKKYYNLGLLAWIVATLWAGHLGGEITHGENFVFGSSQADEAIAVDENTPVFAALVKPIFSQKCISCHRQGKAKGDLKMETAEQIMAGGKGGVVIVPGDKDASEILRRIHLPQADDEHMPPKSKTQLTPTEIEILENWIAAGADFKSNLARYSDSTYHAFFAAKMEELYRSGEPSYGFDAADDEVIAALNTPFRTVTPLSEGSPALHATLFVRATYQSQLLRDLEEIENQLVNLTLTNLPITDEDVSFIGKFRNLEKLILNGTDITGASLHDLADCAKLKSLGLSSTSLGAEHLQKLASLPALRKVTLWNTGLEPQATTHESLEHIDFDFGFEPDPEDTLTLSKPLLTNDKSILAEGEKVALRSMFAGVKTHFTLDGSEPSESSPLYNEPLAIGNGQVLKARAFKDGWAPSEIATYAFYRLGLSPTNIELLSFPNPQYQAEGAATLYDGEKGQASNLRTPFWLGYRENPLEALVSFEDHQELSRIVISTAQNLRSWVMPPKEIILWGGSDEDNLEMLVRVVPEQPEEGAATKEVPIEIKVPRGHYAFLKITMNPVNSLPKWHQGAGEEGWVFADEILFYAD